MPAPEDSSAGRPQLRALARRVGILDEYIDITGNERRLTSDDTRADLLHALGFDASDEAAAARSLEALNLRQIERLMDPVRVVRESVPQARTAKLRTSSAPSRSIEWAVELSKENGETQRAEGKQSVHPRQRAIQIPLPFPAGKKEKRVLGYHSLRVWMKTGNTEREAEQSFIVTPQTCFTPKEALGERRVFGICANLYTLRSRRNWGAGDLTDLGQLIEKTRSLGAAFVGFNPLHAVRNRGEHISPYQPLSRLFRNPLYLDVTAIPELANSPEARDGMSPPDFRKTLSEIQRARHVDYERVMNIKLPILRALYRTFVERHRGRETERGREFARYVAKGGDCLTKFATFLALEEKLHREGSIQNDWRSWPAKYRDPESPEVRAFRETYAEEVDFHCYLQFELDRQLSSASAKARACGMPIGLYQDLALGVAPSGSDAWSFQDLFIQGATLGAPPDDYSATGQDWQSPPLNPYKLVDDQYQYWIRLLRASFAHSGALRIDHIIGLFRQFWIPAGRLPTEGAYIRPPTNDLLSILALESHRNRTIVIGEDLGTVPVGVPAALARRGIFSNRLLYFERSRNGRFKPTSRISNRALVTVNNHDLPPFAGQWNGTDLQIRRKVEQISSDEELREVEAQRKAWKDALLHRLRSERLLPAEANSKAVAEICAAAHAYLCRIRTPFVGLSLDDLAGETEPVNLPGIRTGVAPGHYLNWSRRMRLSIEDIWDTPTARTILAAVRERIGDK
jgi:4-alpha-glucanotransferase